MKLPSLVMLLACATTAATADSQSTGIPASLPRYAYRPLVEDYYPPVSRSLKEQGMAKLKLCYGDRGSSNQVTVEKSSGFVRLDEAAVRWGKAVRITPGLSRGQPQPGCVVVPVKFSLEKSQQAQDRNEDLLLPEVEAPPVLDSLRVPPPRPGRFIPLNSHFKPARTACLARDHTHRLSLFVAAGRHAAAAHAALSGNLCCTPLQSA